MDQQHMSNTSTLRWMGREYKVWIETVTPDRAAKILESGADNRKLRTHRVQRYASDMAKGKWRLTGESVRLDEKGALLNGQHRLRAVIMSGATVAMMFVTGVSSTTRLVQDTGLPKSDKDWSALSVRAIRIVKALSRVVSPRLSSTMSEDDKGELYTIIGADHIEWSIANAATKGITNKAPVQGALAILPKLNPERAALFMSRLKEHAFPPKSPESALDSILTSIGAKHQEHETQNALRAVVAAARDSEKPCAQLKGLGDKDRDWLIKAAGLEKIRTIHQRDDA